MPFSVRVFVKEGVYWFRNISKFRLCRSICFGSIKLFPTHKSTLTEILIIQEQVIHQPESHLIIQNLQNPQHKKIHSLTIPDLRMHNRNSLKNIIHRFSQYFAIFLFGESSRDVQGYLVDIVGQGVYEFFVAQIDASLLDVFLETDELGPGD